MSNVKSGNDPSNFDNACRAFDSLDGKKQTELKEALAEEMSMHVHKKRRSHGIHRDESTKEELRCTTRTA